MAIGAQQKDTLRMVLKQGLTLIFVGTIAGWVASSVLMRCMASEIWNVSTTDPRTFSVVAAMVVVVGLTASVFPTRRAARVDPIVALRYDEPFAPQ
jgi:ABC-type antimicrobial peptide transport system permease subunit